MDALFLYLVSEVLSRSQSTRSNCSGKRRPRFPQRSEKHALRLVTQLLVLRVFGSGRTSPAIPELFAAARRRYAARAPPLMRISCVSIVLLLALNLVATSELPTAWDNG